MPTTRQKIAFKEVLNGTKLSKAMIKAHYAKSTSLTTGKLTRTKGWEELMEQHLPDKLLAKVHKEGLASYKVEKGAVIGGEVGIASAEIQVPDFSTRHKYLDSAYKLKGRYPDGEVGDKTFNVTQIIINPSNGNTGNQSNSETGVSLASTE